MNPLYCTILLLALTGASLANVDRTNDVREYYKKLAAKKEPTANDVCSECKTIVSDLKNALSDPSKLDRIKFVLKLVCDYLGGEEAKQCKNMIDNLDMLIHQLQPFLENPEQLCKEIGLCATEKISVTSRVTLVMMKSLLRNLNTARSNDILCDECMFVGTELKDLLQQQSVQQKLKEEIENICKLLRSLQQQCDDFIEQYFNILLQAIQSVIQDPKQLCTELQMCSGFRVEPLSLYRAKVASVPLTRVRMRNYHNQRQSAIGKFLFLYNQIQTTNGQSTTCVLCDVGLKNLITMLNDPEVLNNVGLKLSQILCSFLPNEFQSNCVDFSKVYAMSVIRAIVNKWNPDDVCMAIDACTNSSIVSISEMTEQGRSEAVCDACKTFAEFASYEFRQKQLQDEVVELLKTEVCDKLPGDLSAQCSNSVENYIPTAMVAVADFISQPGFCVQVYLCSAQDDDLD